MGSGYHACKDCKWSKRPNGNKTPWIYAQCTHPRLSTSPTVDPVSGGKITRYTFCSVERRYDPCGRTGKLWEAK